MKLGIDGSETEIIGENNEGERGFDEIRLLKGRIENN